MKHNWEYKKLGEVCEIKNGKNQKDVENPSGVYPIYGSGGVMGYADDFICQEECTIIGRKGSINKPIFVTEKFWNVDTAFGLSPDRECVNPKYLYYFCVNYDFMKHNRATTLPSLVKSDLLKIQIPVPPKDIQEQIVAELDTINEGIAELKEQIKDLDNLAKTLFYETFGDPISNPKGWEVKKFGELTISINYGTSAPSNENGKYPYIRMNNITDNGYLDFTNLKYIDVSEEDLEKYLVREGDILFNRTNSREKVGKTALYNIKEKMIIAGYIIRVRANLEILNPVFAVRYLNLAD